MLKYKKLKEKEVNILNLKDGDIFKVNGKLFSFLRIKRGGINMLATNLENEKDYNIRIRDISDTKIVIGSLIKNISLKEEKTDNSISLKDVKVDETVIVMTGRGQSVPQLYKVVEINPRKAYSHILKNPVTGRKEQFKGTDSWKIFRINDLIKKN